MKKVFAFAALGIIGINIFCQSALSISESLKQSLTSVYESGNSSASNNSELLKSGQLNSLKKARNVETEDYDSFYDDSFEPSVQLAMSSTDYLVTPGDIYSLYYAAGTTPVTYSIVVDSTYRVRVSNLAILDGQGKSFATLKRQVEDIVTKNFPMSGVQFVMVSPASFKVTLTGEVTNTTEVSAWALTRVSSILKNDSTSFASKRFVTITNTNGTKKTYDLFKAKRNGDLKENPYLRPDDIVCVERFDRIVAIDGAIERPGVYELGAGENLKDLIEVYGHGFIPRADKSKIEVSRTIDGSEAVGKNFYVSYEDVQKEDTELKSYDCVTVSSLEQQLPVIYVEGAISDSEYDPESVSGGKGTTLETSDRKTVKINKGESYAYFVRRNEKWFGNVSDLKNAYILRGGNRIPLDIERILHDLSFTSDLTLESDDVLVIPFRQFFVSVSGSVQTPGRYPYIPNRTYEYYVGLAGGFIKTQNKWDAVIITDVNGKKIKKNTIIEPEMTITAKANSFTYFVNQYSGVISVISTSFSAIVSAIAISNAM